MFILNENKTKNVVSQHYLFNYIFIYLPTIYLPLLQKLFINIFIVYYL